MARQAPPTRSRPARSPLRRLEQAPRGGVDEPILDDGCADLLDDGVQRLAHLVGCVAPHVFSKRGAVDLTARPPRTSRESVHLGEEFIRHGNGCLHTGSITRSLAARKRRQRYCAPMGVSGLLPAKPW